jgi:hypothetical protein
MFSSATVIKWAAVLLVPMAAFWTPFLTARLQEPSPESGLSHESGIRLELTAEASQALQLNAGDALAFPAADAGFSAYHRVPSAGGGFGLDKAAVDAALLAAPRPSSHRAGVATLLRTGNNYTIFQVPIANIDNLITDVRLYYDVQGWMVAYFPRGHASSQAWQALGLNTENPVLTDVTLTTLLEAINEVLVAVAGTAPLTPQQAGYYHWQYPTATRFLMFATAVSQRRADSVVFAVPDSFTVHEVSVSMWVSKNLNACARATLDGMHLTGDRCNRSFTYRVVDPAQFSSQAAHTLTLEQVNRDEGASGLLGMLIYSAP